jgi:hypothetical protein
MLATTRMVLVGFAALSVACEATLPAAAFMGVGMWMMGHAA